MGGPLWPIIISITGLSEERGRHYEDGERIGRRAGEVGGCGWRALDRGERIGDADSQICRAEN